MRLAQVRTHGCSVIRRILMVPDVRVVGALLVAGDIRERPGKTQVIGRAERRTDTLRLVHETTRRIALEKLIEVEALPGQWPAAGSESRSR